MFERFTIKNYKHEQFQEYFVENSHKQAKGLRKHEKFKVFKFKNEAFKKSTTIQMQYLANDLESNGQLE